MALHEQTDSGEGILIAVAQTPSTLGALEVNIFTISHAVAAAAASGNALVVFPECAVSGYMFNSRAEVVAASMEVDDPRLRPIFDAASNGGVHAIVGLLEADGQQVYNTAILVGPSGLEGRYRKQHLPELGADRFVDPGNGSEPRVYDAGPIRVGLMICFDLRFPESARELALLGADVIAMPTNWPTASVFLAEHMTRVRAVENLVYLAVADRSDSESGTQFLGRSQIVDPAGQIVADAGSTTGIVSARIDLHRSRTKRLEFSEPNFSLPVFGGRRPEMYTALTAPITVENQI